MGVFGAYFGCIGVVGFNECCSGTSIGDGGFTLVCISGRRGDGGFNGCCLGASIGDGGFMLVCISGCRGFIGFNVATSQLPVREKVRPAYEKWPKIGGLWRAGRVFSRKHRWRGRAGRTLSRNSRGTERAGRVLSHHHSGTPAAGRPSSQIEQGTDSLRPPRADGHEKSTPEGVLGRNAEPPPVDRTEGGRCAPGGTRTPNLLNRNQMLYPLSYGRFAVWLSISLHASRRDAKSNDMA